MTVKCIIRNVTGKQGLISVSSLKEHCEFTVFKFKMKVMFNTVSVTVCYTAPPTGQISQSALGEATHPHGPAINAAHYTLRHCYIFDVFE